MSNLGYARNANPASTDRVVEIISVDGEARKAVGLTRERSEIDIDCRYPVGAMMVTPGVGETWWVERTGSIYTLKRRTPAKSPELLEEGSEGQVTIGSSGPTIIRGSSTRIRSGLTVEQSITSGDALTVPGEFVLGGVRYRDAGSALERREPTSSSWFPVASTVIRFVSPSASISATYVDRCYSPSRELTGAYMRVTGGPVGSDLVAEVQHYTTLGWEALTTLTISDGTTSESVDESLSHSQVSGDYLRIEFTSVGSGTPATGVVVDILAR